MVQKQYITTCGHDLAIFLKERVPKDMKEMIRLAEQYTEVHDNGATNTQNTAAAAYTEYRPVQGERQCYICHRTNYIARDCYYREQNPGYISNRPTRWEQNHSNRAKIKEQNRL